MSIKIAPSKYTQKGNEKECKVSKISAYIKGNKNGYEIIDASTEYVKPYFDVDVNDYEEQYETIKSDQKSFLTKIKKFISKEYGCLKKDLAISTTPRDNKISYHIVVTTKKIKYEHLIKKITTDKDKYKKLLIDISVYGKYQKIRLIGCAKEKDNIKKKMMTHKKLSSHLITYVDGITDTIIYDDPKSQQVNEKTEPVSKNVIISKVSYERLYNICDSLAVSRVDDREPWSLIMMAIFNIAYENNFIDNGKELIHIISKKSVKYNKASVDAFINTINYAPNGKKLGYLLDLLKKDDFEAFRINTLPYDRSYNNVKADFEKNSFKIMYPYTFCVDKREEMYLYTETQFSGLNKNNHFYTIDGDELVKNNFFSTWISDENIRTYEKIDFYPNIEKCPSYIYNLFKGFEVEKLDNKIVDENKINLIIEHIKKLVGGDKKCYDYFIRWLAQIVQQPDIIKGTAVVFVSEQGTGKNVFLDWFGKKILGEKYYNSIQDTNHIFGQYAEGMKHKLLVNLDEASGKDQFQNSDKLKHLITSPEIMYEKKYMPSMKLNNYCRLIFTTNNETPVKIEHSDRRFVIFRCESEHKNNVEYFTNLINQMSDPVAIKTFYEHLKNIDISNYDFVNNRPMSDIYKEMSSVNYPKEALFVMHLLEQGKLKAEARSSTLYESFTEFLYSDGYTDYSTNHAKFTRNIKRIGGVGSYRSNGTIITFDHKKLIKYVTDNYDYSD